MTTNSVKGFVGVFKRGFRGIYQHCGEQHLQRYLNEFACRFNNRSALGANDTIRAHAALRGITGKRLTYRRADEATDAYAVRARFSRLEGASAAFCDLVPLSAGFGDLVGFGVASIRCSAASRRSPSLEASLAMDDLEPFESSRTLLASVEVSITDFTRDVAAFVEGNGYTIVKRPDHKAREDIYSYRFQKRIPPPLRLKASRILQDIKHTLDQATCDAALVTGAMKVGHIHFPIGKDAAHFRQEADRRLKGVDAELAAFIREFKCHYGGNDKLYSLLALAGPSKHQRIIRLANMSDGLMLHVDKTNGSGFCIGGKALVLSGNHWNELRNELDFFRIEAGADFDADFRPVLDVVLGEGHAPLDGPAAAVLRDAAREAQRIVVALEAEARRIAQDDPPLSKE